jgi:intracellular sulfur oxidation DsrE/DsrF family protein
VEVSDGNGGTDTATLNITVDAPSAPTCHVENMTPFTVSAGKGRKHGAVAVVVNNSAGSVVANATVTVSFAGDFNETITGVTDANGSVNLQTVATQKGGVSFSVCVDSITHASLTYDSNDNAVTCVN